MVYRYVAVAWKVCNLKETLNQPFQFFSPNDQEQYNVQIKMENPTLCGVTRVSIFAELDLIRWCQSKFEDWTEPCVLNFF